MRDKSSLWTTRDLAKAKFWVPTLNTFCAMHNDTNYAWDENWVESAIAIIPLDDELLSNLILKCSTQKITSQRSRGEEEMKRTALL